MLIDYAIGKALVVKFVGSQKLYVDFWLCGGGRTPGPHVTHKSSVFFKYL